MKKEYFQVRGLYFTAGTDKNVAEWLCTAYERKEKIRLYYGDKETGRDWCEEYDTRGTVGRSTGAIKIPLLIKTSRSSGGGAILTDCIVKLVVGNRVVYTHPGYNAPVIEVKPGKDGLWAVWANGSLHACVPEKTANLIASRLR